MTQQPILTDEIIQEITNDLVRQCQEEIRGAGAAISINLHRGIVAAVHSSIVRLVSEQLFSALSESLKSIIEQECSSFQPDYLKNLVKSAFHDAAKDMAADIIDSKASQHLYRTKEEA